MSYCAGMNKEFAVKCKDCFTVKPGTSSPPPPASSSSSSSATIIMPSGLSFVHSGVTCNECKAHPVIGIRYKCTEREDYDLCEFCERKKIQPYPMIKIVEPIKGGGGGGGHYEPSPSPLLHLLGGVAAAEVPFQLKWNTSISNKNLTFTNEDKSVERNGNVSCYPAAFILVPYDYCEVNILLEKATISSNWLTFGICCSGMVNASSDGFGKTDNTWGLRDDRSSATLMPVIAANGSDINTLARKLRQGDLLTMKIDVKNGIAELFVNHNEYTHRFTIPPGRPSDYWLGLTFANDHKVTILPSRTLTISPTAKVRGGSSVSRSGSGGGEAVVKCRHCGKGLSKIELLFGIETCKACTR
jgi:hypothetical protein